MVMLSSELDFSAEFTAAKRELEEWRNRYADLQCEYTELTETVGPNLETEYMMTVGRKEHALFLLQAEYQQCRREIALYQAAANRGETLTAAAAAEIIAAEFAGYQEELRARQHKIAAAEKQFAAEKLSPEESQAVKTLYHQLVRKLHPDINPGQPPQAAELWHRVIEAYKNFDWKKLTLLADMSDEILAGRRDLPVAPDTLGEVHELTAELQAKVEALGTALAALLAKPPLSWRDWLRDAAAVMQRRQSLDQEIAELTARLEEVRRIRDAARGQ